MKSTAYKAILRNVSAAHVCSWILQYPCQRFTLLKVSKCSWIVIVICICCFLIFWHLALLEKHFLLWKHWLQSPMAGHLMKQVYYVSFWVRKQKQQWKESRLAVAVAIPSFAKVWYVLDAWGNAQKCSEMVIILFSWECNFPLWTEIIKSTT